MPPRTLLKPVRSELMEVVGMYPVAFHDVGGWIFPDHPNLTTPPNEEVIFFIKQLVAAWGDEANFIAANTKIRRSKRSFNSENFRAAEIWGDRHSAEWGGGNKWKDYDLIDHYDVWGKTDMFPHNFVECAGPEKKGSAMKEKLMDASEGCLSVAFDNRFLVAMHMPIKTHSIVFNGRDTDEDAVQEWFKKGKPFKTGRLHDTKTIQDVTATVIRLHFNKLHELIKIRGWENEEDIRKMLEEERTRMTKLFLPLMPAATLAKVMAEVG